MTHEAVTLVLAIETRPQTPGGGWTNCKPPIHRAAEGPHQASRGIFWVVQALRRREHTMRIILLAAPCAWLSWCRGTRLGVLSEVPRMLLDAQVGSSHGQHTSTSLQHHKLPEGLPVQHETHKTTAQQVCCPRCAASTRRACIIA
jgi:hypothetical protein